jgi:hypothetical protein
VFLPRSIPIVVTISEFALSVIAYSPRALQ